MDPRETELSIRQQGAVIVNGAIVVRESPDIACISVDLRSKRAQISGVCGDLEGTPELMLSASAETLHLDETKAMDEETLIGFPEFNGWRVFAADLSRYTLSVCLVRE
jgi:hypothetical protein